MPSLSNKKTIKRSLQPHKSVIKIKQNTESILIIGIGASAGGLEAIEKFFTYIPTNINAAFVVITHLDPNYISIMPDLIKKYTDITVLPINDGIKIQPNTVYVTPSGTNIALKDDTLRFSKQKKPHSTNHPINFFFESLAKANKNNAIGIILSGAGSDGALGLKAIKSNGGFTIVQDPHTAEYNGMPQSAIDAGLVDATLPVEKIPERLIQYLYSKQLKDKSDPAEIKKIFSLLRLHTGHDFSSYKLNTLYRRIEKKMHAKGIKTLADYVTLLQNNPSHVKSLFKNLLIGVTRFFRDKKAFEILEKDILPNILNNKEDDYCIRVWIPGCSTGEEVYSIAIIIRECLDKLKLHYPVQIFGTDIDANALEKARAGVYSENISNEVSSARLKRFFIKENNTFKVKKEIRSMVIFAVQNLITDPPFTRIDLLCCRNVMIYFNAQLQKKIFPIFHYSLRPKGILFLGTAETTTGYDNLFRLIAKKWKIYERKNTVSGPNKFNFPSCQNMLERTHIDRVGENHWSNEKFDLTKSINKFLICHYASSSLIIDKKGTILHSHGRAARYISMRQKAKKDHKNFFDIVPLKSKNKLAIAVRNAISKNNVINYKLPIEEAKNLDKYLYLKIMPIRNEPLAPEIVFILFEIQASNSQKKSAKHDKISINRSNKKIIDMAEELQYTKENLQSTIEELQSSNEELQSTNEEIETSKEELQSLNEEFVSVNTELQNKIDQLSCVHDDMNNLFNSIDIAAVFLDNDFHIKKFTPKVTELIPLIQSDIGRSISHFASNIKYERLIDESREVLKSLTPKSIDVKARNNKFYLINILPYRTLANIIDGVIITFVDVTKIKETEKKLNKSNIALNNSLTFTQSIIDTIPEPMLVLNENLSIISANKAFTNFFHMTADEIDKKFIYKIGNKQWNNPVLRKKLEEVITKNTALDMFEFEGNFVNVGPKKLILNAMQIIQNELVTNTLLLIIREKPHG
jgi:two-component system CheB/CheR fusion protein